MTENPFDRLLDNGTPRAPADVGRLGGFPLNASWRRPLEPEPFGGAALEAIGTEPGLLVLAPWSCSSPVLRCSSGASRRSRGRGGPEDAALVCPA
ncbi:hypothetical protein [Actinocorallia populi]|uniref:hypothetical protein n=1 Tax=Actinocorallia populi TaxID=2079200 RepID=UPI000D09679B|nr:hypothetical protein [Actinocorallia populi]